MKKTLCLFITVILMLIFSSCGTDAEMPVPEHTQSMFNINELFFSKEQVMLSEGHDNVGAPYGLSKTLEVCEYEGITYAFEPQIGYDDRAECIQTTNAILSRIGIGKNIQVNIYTESTYDRMFVENGLVFTHAQDWNTSEYTVSLLYGLLGEYCHYGILYGYASYLNNELFADTATVYREMPTLGDNINFLDLNLLCFRTEFVSADEVEKSKQIASIFVSGYIESYGEAEFLKLAKASGTVEGIDKLQNELTGFYKEIGIDYTPTDILYRLGGRGYDYIVKCPYAVMYIEKNWVDMNKDMCPYTYDNFLHENYDDVKQYFTVNIGELGQFRELFGLYPYNDDLNIYFTNQRTRDSYYDASIHSISLKNTASLSHEYIHSLTYEHNILEEWAIEGFAKYFSYYYNYYGNAMSTVDYNTTNVKYVLEYKDSIGRDIDMNKDFAEVFHIAAYCYSYNDPNDGSGYVAGASFIDYLISRFGEKQTLDIICVTHDFGELSYEELVKDWIEFLMENYSQYTKMK